MNLTDDMTPLSPEMIEASLRLTEAAVNRDLDECSCGRCQG